MLKFSDQLIITIRDTANIKKENTIKGVGVLVYKRQTLWQGVSLQTIVKHCFASVIFKDQLYVCINHFRYMKNTGFKF